MKANITVNWTEQKRFAVNAAAFCLIAVVLFLLINWFFCSIVLKDSLLQRSQQQFDEEKAGVKILILGDSYPQDAVNPKWINNSFNFATSGESYIETYYKFKSILKDGRFRPEAILLPIDLHSFISGRVPLSEDEWYWQRFIDYQELSAIQKLVSPIKNFISAKFPLFGGGTEILYHWLKKNELVSGHMIIEKDFSKSENSEKEAELKAKEYFYENNLLDSTMLTYFKRILTLAESQGIKVYLVKYPITEQYYNATKTYVDEIEYYKKISIITNEYPEIAMLDYQKIFWEKEEYFHNSDHTNYRGAVELSQLICKDLKKDMHNLSC